MKRAGQIALTPFPFTNLSATKLRPVLMLKQASRRFDDWLVCMVSSQLQQAETGFDEILAPTDADFAITDLKGWNRTLSAMPQAIYLLRVACIPLPQNFCLRLENRGGRYAKIPYE